MTLHQAIKKVILGNGPAEVAELTNRINEQNLYKQRNGEDVPRNQVSARIRKYSHMFEKNDGVVDINKANEIVWLEAYVGGYFGTSYEVEIHLEYKKVIYKELERANDIEMLREFILDDDTAEKFQAEINSIRIMDWDKEYYAPVLDGTSWSLHIKTLEGGFESSGSNAFPKNWNRFCRSIEKVVGGKFR